MKLNKVMKILMIVTVFIYSMGGWVNSTEAAVIETNVSSFLVSKSFSVWNGSWIDVFDHSAPTVTLFIGLDIFADNYDDYSWREPFIGRTNRFTLLGGFGSYYKYNIVQPAKLRIYTDGVLYNEITLNTYKFPGGAVGSYHSTIAVDIPTMRIDGVFKNLKVQISMEVEDTGISSEWSSPRNDRVYFKTRHTDEATARILGTSISAEAAEKAAKEAKQKAIEAANNAEQARLQAVAKAEEARIQAQQAADKADQARLEAIAAASTAEAARLQAFEASQRAEAARLEAIAVGNKIDSLDISMENRISEVSNNLSLMNRQINNTTAIQNIVSLNKFRTSIENRILLGIDYSPEYELSIEGLPPGANISYSDDLIIIDTSNVKKEDMDNLIRIKVVASKIIEEEGVPVTYTSSRTLSKNQFWFDIVNID